MPLTTYVNETQARVWRNVDDKEMNAILQDLRTVSGEDWLIKSNYYFVKEGWFKPKRLLIHYTLMVDVHGEFQVISLCGDRESTRQDVINYMLGYAAGCLYSRTIKHVV